MGKKHSKNLSRVQSMVDGTYGGKIQSGYDGEVEPTRKVGDKWTDSDGTPWEQRNGYKVKGRLAVSGQSHPSWDKKCSMCESLILKPWDKDTHKADGRCYHCQMNYELDLSFDKPIRWFAYRRLKELQNMKSIEKEMVQWVDEFEKIRNEKIYDMSVANAMANSNVEMSIKKNT